MAKQVHQGIFENDEALFVEGEENHSFHFIVDGHVELSRKSFMGWTGTISVLSPGDFTGEGNMFGDGPANISADAILGQVRTLSLSRKKMQRLITDHPSLAFALLKGMNQRINRMEAFLVNVG